MCRIILFFLLICLFIHHHTNAQSSANAAVQIYAKVQATPPQIKLKWVGDKEATSYTLYRKNKDDNSWGSAIASLPATATEYIDNNVANNSAYEYKIEEVPNASSQRYSSSYGYIYAGINVPEVHTRGTVIFIVDNTFAIPLEAELSRMQEDMVGDGWSVIRHNVEPTDHVENIKALIKADYNLNPSSVKSVYLFGHIPQPYSGDLDPDGHENHQGAWPADVFYGDMDGVWTDATVFDTSAYNKEIINSKHNYNIPGDGKYDQSSIPTDVELQVGRVDLSNMTLFSLSEQELLRQYLNKDHDFRHNIISPVRAGLVNDNFGYFYGEAFAANGYRNFAPMFGPDKVTSRQYFSALKIKSYLWSYLTGPGKGDGQGILSEEGTIDDFVTGPVNTVFTMLFGSYFGDWDVANNFLRGPLASAPMGLVSIWAGRPHWFVHHMALGETIGYSTMLSQNNSNVYQPSSLYSRLVHIGLMGDPTLRMQFHPVDPISNLEIEISEKFQRPSETSYNLKWNKPKGDILGYHIYRSSSMEEPFSKINTTLVTDTNFSDTSSFSGDYVYMVRVLKPDSSASGTYYNLSQGIFKAVKTITKELNYTSSIIISPNPGKGLYDLIIENCPKKNILISVINSRGENVKELSINNDQGNLFYKLNIEGQLEGIYLLKFESENFYAVKKIIKN